MKKFLRIAICLVFFGFGLVRIGAASVLMSQLAGLINFADFQEPINETQSWLSVHNPDALISLTPIVYFAIILVMGLALTAGAIGSFRRKT